MKSYYDKQDIVLKLKELEKLKQWDVNTLLDLIKSDHELSQAFYSENSNEKWLNMLKEAGEFDHVPQAIRSDEGVTYQKWPQSKYLAVIAKKLPEDVLEIIKGFDTDNVFVIHDCLEALQVMPSGSAVDGMDLVRRLLNKEDYCDWHFVGEPTAKMMVRFAEQGCMEQAFELAKYLLHVKSKIDDTFHSWHTMVSRFASYHYNEIMFKFFVRLWEKDSLRAGKLLVDILDNQIEREQVKSTNESYPKVEEKLKEILGEEAKQEEEEFDVTEHSYILMPKIDQVEKKRDDIAGVLVGGVRAVGEYLMSTDTAAAKKYIVYLEGKERTIFKRVMIYLLKFAPNKEQWNNRINTIISKRERFCTFALKEEYRVLLHDKWEEISESDKEEYIHWAKEQHVDDEEEYKKWYLDVKKQEVTVQDIEVYNNRLRAEALYCIRDKCPDLYGEYLAASGLSEKDVKPKPPIRVSAGWTGEPSKSPLKPETMKTMEPVEVVKYVLDYDTNHPDTKEDEHAWEEYDPKEALANAFKLDVVEKAMEYIQTDATLIVQMGRRYVRNFFYGVDEALNTQKLENPDWGLILEISKLFIEQYGMNKEYGATTQTIPKILERGLKEEFCPIPMNENILNKVLGILKELLKNEDETDVDEGGDPISGCINCVQGVAFENFIRFGLYCKKRDPKLYERQYASGFRRTLQNILDRVEKVKILCVFGEYFSNLCWIEEAWVRENLDRIFSEEDARQWDAIWGAYINWDHPTKVAFKMAIAKYEYAIDRIGQKNKFKYDEDIDKKLVEHLMLAYWQGWEEENTLLNSLLDKASDELLAKASQHLSSGFEFLKEHEKDMWRKGVEKRLLAYWQQRVDIMQKNPKEHQLEAQEFTGWVKDSPLKKEDTFRLLEKTLRLTGGKVGLYEDASRFVEGVCELGVGFEFKALWCMNRVLENSEMRFQMGMHFFGHDEALTTFMDKIVELPGGYEDIKQIREEAIKLADGYGRLGVEKFRGHYEKLKGQVRSGRTPGGTGG